VLESILSFIAGVTVFFRSRSDTALEVLALRQQVAVLKRKRPRPLLNSLDRLFWTALRHFWSRWADVLVIVKPETVIGWHRVGFRLYWRWRSRPRGGRSKITEEIRVLIRRLAQENPDWGAPRIHGELQKLGFVVSERSVARYLRRVRRRGDPGKRWLTFLQNHREVIAAFDFFTVPTVTFQLLYCFFVIEHGRRRILHFNVTRYPTAERGFPRSGSVPVRRLRSRCDIPGGSGYLSKGNGTEAQTDEPPSPLAEWHRGKMGRKLSARDPRPRHRAERTASPPADRRIRELPSRGSHSRFPGKRHAEPTDSGAQASSEGNRDFNAAPGWSSPSLRVARSGIGSSPQPVCSRCSPGRNRRRRAPGRRSCRSSHLKTLRSTSVRTAVSVKVRGNRRPLFSAHTEPASRATFHVT
jgi:putative transposase